MQGASESAPTQRQEVITNAKLKVAEGQKSQMKSHALVLIHRCRSLQRCCGVTRPGVRDGGGNGGGGGGGALHTGMTHVGWVHQTTVIAWLRHHVRGVVGGWRHPAIRPTVRHSIHARVGRRMEGRIVVHGGKASHGLWVLRVHHGMRIEGRRCRKHGVNPNHLCCMALQGGGFRFMFRATLGFLQHLQHPPLMLPEQTFHGSGCRLRRQCLLVKQPPPPRCFFALILVGLTECYYRRGHRGMAIALRQSHWDVRV